MQPISYSQTSEFSKDFKKLLKRFRTLEEDFENMKKSAIEVYHLIKTNHIVRIQNYCSQDYLSKKVRKMACKSLKGKGVQSGLRVIYVFEQKENKVTFIEMYYKQNQENESRERLSAFIKKLEI
jgi:mRNA-degrading endonuclease RelE of RelBE toxin-antitoxin system